MRLSTACYLLLKFFVFWEFEVAKAHTTRYKTCFFFSFQGKNPFKLTKEIQICVFFFKFFYIFLCKLNSKANQSAFFMLITEYTKQIHATSFKYLCFYSRNSYNTDDAFHFFFLPKILFIFVEIFLLFVWFFLAFVFRK